jgi:hypothetical protein
MAKYKLKNNEIEALRIPGPDSIRVVGTKGEQTGNKGDYILFTGPTPHEREVIPADKFELLYELVDPSQKAQSTLNSNLDVAAMVIQQLTGIRKVDPLTGGETELDEAAIAALASGDEKEHEQVTSSIDPLLKTSGDGKDAGAWTEHNDGTPATV